MRLRRPLMALEVGLARKLLVAAIDGAGPDRSVAGLLPVPGLPRRRRVLLLFQPLIGHLVG